MNTIEHPYRTLNSLGWQWHDQGAVLWVNVDGKSYSVYVPLRTLLVEFGRDLASVGCPLPQGIGAPTTVGGFFSSIKRGFRKVTRKVKKAVPKGIRRAARNVYRKAKKTATKVVRAAKKYGRRALKLATSREAQMLVGALTVAVPALAPATGPLLAAQEALRHVDMGVKVAEKVQRGAKLTRGMMRDLQRAGRAKRELEVAREGAIRGDREAQMVMGALRQLA